MHSKTYALILILFLLGVTASYIGFQTSLWLGAGWISEKADKPWGMNTYISLTGSQAYLFCGVLSVFFSGISAGVAVALLLVRSKWSIIALFPAIFLFGLGFNTMDWMISHVVYGSKGWPLWMLNLSDVFVESWNFYFFLGVLPLFLGGFFLTVSATFAALKAMRKL